jgi:hypothetical protein
VCDDELEIDRVAWAAGMPLGVVPLVDDRLRSSPYRIPILASLDAGELPLMAALVPSQDVWRIDSDAGARAIDVAPGQRVWYLRVAGGSRGDSAGRAVRWMLLGASDLHVLASGASGTSASTGEASLEQP